MVQSHVCASLILSITRRHKTTQGSCIAHAHTNRNTNLGREGRRGEMCCRSTKPRVVNLRLRILQTITRLKLLRVFAAPPCLALQGGCVDLLTLRPCCPCRRTRLLKSDPKIDVHRVGCGLGFGLGCGGVWGGGSA